MPLVYHLIGVTAVALTLAGCGGGSSDAEEALDQAWEGVVAFPDGSEMEFEISAWSLEGVRDCEYARFAVDEAEVWDVDRSGDRPVVTIRLLVSPYYSSRCD